MKRILLKNQILVYTDANCSLFINFNVLKIKNINIILYHVTKNVISNNYPDKVSIKPIIFLSQ